MIELRGIGAYARAGAPGSRLVVWLRACIASLLARRAARQTVRSLALLSDRELRDIGLLRADIAEVASARSRSRAACEQQLD